MSVSSPFHLHFYKLTSSGYMMLLLLPVFCGLSEQSLSFPVEKDFKPGHYKLQ